MRLPEREWDKYAEKNPEKFHGIGPFDKETGEVLAKKTKKTYTDIFAESLVELARENKKVVAITAAMPSGTGLKAFKKHYPKRFFDVGIAEEHAVTFAAGLAAQVGRRLVEPPHRRGVRRPGARALRAVPRPPDHP